MKQFLSLLLLILCYNASEAQFIKEKSINAQIGYGISAPDRSQDDFVDSGILVQGELVLKVLSWFELRPYAGVIFTNSNGEDFNGNPTMEKAETKAFLLGGKFRLRAPIPWIAPYLEFGVGTSIGKFETMTAFDNINKGGIIYHIPLAFGLELGKRNNLDLALAYYFQPTVKQFAGGISVGYTFPLNRNTN